MIVERAKDPALGTFDVAKSGHLRGEPTIELAVCALVRPLLMDEREGPRPKLNVHLREGCPDANGFHHERFQRRHEQ